MARSVQAIVKPEMLRWARRSSRFDIETVAKKLQVKPKRVSMWENGESRPTVKQLRKLADVYKRPIAVFYLSEPPRGFQAMKDFRRIPDHDHERMSPELILAIRKAHERRRIGQELAELVELDAYGTHMAVQIGDDPEMAGRNIRNILGVPMDVQFRWPQGRETFNEWRAAFERLGILVFQIYDVAPSEVRGFSLNTGHMPVIAVNVKDSYNGRVFTLFHEIVHVLLHNTGICDLSESQPGLEDDRRVEIFCNRVAGAALTPIWAIHSEPTVKTRKEYGHWEDSEISGLAGRFGVSREAMVRRLVIAGLADEEFYHAKRNQYLAEYENNPTPSKSGRGPAPHIKALSSLGYTFVRLVLQNFYRDNITGAALADYLDMKLGHLGKLETALASSRQR